MEGLRQGKLTIKPTGYVECVSYQRELIAANSMSTTQATAPFETSWLNYEPQSITSVVFRKLINSTAPLERSVVVWMESLRKTDGVSRVRNLDYSSPPGHDHEPAMKLAPLLGILGCFGVVSAQYFSAGWSPGEPVQHETARDSSPEGSQPQYSSASTFDWSSILKSGPVMSILTRLGFNATEWRDSVQAISLWDDRIPLVTDENFNDLIVNEGMTPEEEAKRMWFLVM